MGITKSNLFTEEQNELAIIAKAFAHPARITIIQHLLESRSCINRHLVQELVTGSSYYKPAFEGIER